MKITSGTSLSVTGTLSNTGGNLTLTDSSGIAFNGGTASTSGDQTYSGPVTLDTDTTLTSTGGGTIDFGSTVDGSFNLTVSGKGEFDGTVGGTTALAGLSVSGTTALDGGTVTTAGTQSYNGGVALGADTTLASTGGGAITLGSTVDGSFNLTVNTAGVTTFGGAVGGTTALTSLTTDAAGSTDISGGAITTVGAQAYNDAVALGADTTLRSTGAGNITLGSTVDGSFNLTVNTAGITTFGGAVGGTTALSSLTTDAAGSTDINAGTVTTAGAQTYNDAIALGADTTLASTGDGAITLGSTVDGAFGLTTNTSGATTFGGVVGGTTALTSLTIDAGGQATQLNGGSVKTVGAQVYNDAVALGADTTLTSTGSGNITLGSTVDGSFNLTVNTAGITTFGGAVGGTTALASLTAEGSSIAVGGNITTTGNTFLQAASAGGITFAGGTIDSTGSGMVSLEADALTFNGVTTIDAGTFEYAPFTQGAAVTLGTGGVLPNADLHLNANDGRIGAVTVPGTGLTTTAGSITVASAFNAGSANLEFDTTTTGGGSGAIGINAPVTAAAFTVNAAGTITLNDGTDIPLVSTAGGQTYNGAVVLAADATLSTTNSPIDFKSTVDGDYNLTVDAEIGAVTFGGYVGSVTPLASLTVTGPTNLNAGDNGGATNTVTTNGGGQTYNSAVTLGADATLADTGGGTIDFASTVDGAHALTTASTGATIFDGAVGGTTALASLTVAGFNGSAGGTTIDTDHITTSGLQSYSGDVTLAHDTTLSSTGNGTISFGSMIDGAYSLTTDTTGATTFYYLVGSATPLSSLTIDGPTTIQSIAVKTSGAQTYEGAVALNTDATLTGTLVTFGSTVDNTTKAGSAGLTIAGNAKFDGAVGGTLGLGSLDVTGTTLFADGATVATTNADGETGNQTYQGAVTLDVFTVGLTSTGGLVDFGSTIASAPSTAENLAITGNAEFDGAVGTTLLPLGSLSVSGTTVMNGGEIFTTTVPGKSGDQTYTGAVTLEADTTLNASNGGSIKFGSTVDDTGTAGAQSLTIINSGAGGTEFDGAVGGTLALGSLNDASGVATFKNASVTTTNTDGQTGGQSYGEVIVDTDTSLVSTGGSISIGGLNASSAGGAGLSVTATSGTTTIEGNTGTPLGYLTIDGQANLFSSTIATSDAGGESGNQTYEGAVVIGGKYGCDVDQHRRSRRLPIDGRRHDGGHATLDCHGQR